MSGNKYLLKAKRKKKKRRKRIILTLSEEGK